VRFSVLIPAGVRLRLAVSPMPKAKAFDEGSGDIRSFFGGGAKKKPKATPPASVERSASPRKSPVKPAVASASAKASAPDGSDNEPLAGGAVAALTAHLRDPRWTEVLQREFGKAYFKRLAESLARERSSKRIFPPEELTFTAFNLAAFDDVRVVVIGQDPYHDNGQAHGLSFSVPSGVKAPPSLRNIYKELTTDIAGFSTPRHAFSKGAEQPGGGNLEPWARQGVFMLNATLTVQAHKANSHKDIGWQDFTDAVIGLLSKERKDLVFVLWGGFAKKKGKIIDRSRHAVVETAHPSPLSWRHFEGCRCFSAINAALADRGKPEIDWQI